MGSIDIAIYNGKLIRSL